MVEGISPPPRCGERDLELLLRAFLSDEVAEPPRAERLLDFLVPVLKDGD
jgi:hypothetical protein